MFVHFKIDEWLNVTDAPSWLKNLNPEIVWIPAHITHSYPAIELLW